jgi:hypothetical protein
MKAYRISTEIPQDHELVLHLPDDIPAGQAEVLVLTGEGSERSDRESMKAFLDRLASPGRNTRSKKQIDDELLSERNSWD